MRYAPLGPTGLQVSRIGLGTATFGVVPLAEDADRMIGRAIELGINLIDTANSYGNQVRFDRPGAPPAAARQSAEEILGAALTGRRKSVLLCSKVMEPVGIGPNDRGLSRAHICTQIETSLRRLRTDYLDVYYAHHPDLNTPIEQTIRTFGDLIRQGKIRYYALSTFKAWQMTEALWTADRLGVDPPACIQIAYNLANREAEREVLPACAHFGLTATVFSPLGGGLLAGDAALSRPIIGNRRWGGAAFSAAQLELAHQFAAIAQQGGYAAAPLALAWLLSRQAVSSAIIGPETLDELATNAAAADLDPPVEVLARLSELGHS
jgi:aryl-alcohol dehydrogenase-like predicted oxidoreductase